MRRTDDELVGDALDHLETLKRHIGRGDLGDETVADAVCLRLAAAIEAISETSTGFRTATFGDDWKLIWATRNRIAHGYASIDLEMIRNTVTNDLPEFERLLKGPAATPSVYGEDPDDLISPSPEAR